MLWRKAPLFWWVIGLGMGICITGFRCGALAQDCLEDVDCMAHQRCVFLRCVPPLAKDGEEGHPADSGQGEEAPQVEGTPKEARCEGKACLPLGAWCEGDAACESDLRCHQGRCMIPCDPRLGITNQSVCERESVYAVCFRLREDQGICKRPCSLRRSSDYADPACPLGTYCVPQSKESQMPDICAPTSPPAKGIRALGETCSRANQASDCDGSMGGVCVLSGITERCLQACDPRIGGCQGGRICQGTNLSFLGGICQDP